MNIKESNMSILGIGITDTITKINGKPLKSYLTWKGMIVRCYSDKSYEKNITYKDCTVCDEWLNYSNFKQWYNDNYYEIKEQTMCLDKDILFKNNKIYSPDTCVFVPQNINKLFTKRQNYRGDCPIGVIYHNGRFQARCNGNLGHFDTKEEAFYCGYKPTKESYIKKFAYEHKDFIPQNLYEAMINYVVEIND